MDNRIAPNEFPEDQFTASLERQVARIPSSFFLGCAAFSVLASLVCKLSGKDKAADFIGHWPAPFLLVGIYNKLVKQHGSDGQVRINGKSDEPLIHVA
jgi:hypothetical protein